MRNRLTSKRNQFFQQTPSQTRENKTTKKRRQTDEELNQLAAEKLLEELRQGLASQTESTNLQVKSVNSTSLETLEVKAKLLKTYCSHGKFLEAIELYSSIRKMPAWIDRNNQKTIDDIEDTIKIVHDTFVQNRPAYQSIRRS